ncbi:MAG: toxin-antitoxin system YwqK family antitoxin [Bacteroidia bacterium]
MNLKILGIFLIFIFSCGTKYKTKVIEKWGNGKNKIVHLYSDTYDSTNYLMATYYDNGQLEVKGKLKNKIREGFWQWWYKNGNKKEEATYSNGYFKGIKKHWNEDGKLCYRLHFPKD